MKRTKHGVVGSLAAAKPAQENRTPVRHCPGTSVCQTDTAKSIEKPAAHNSAVLQCRLRCINRADHLVLRPEDWRQWYIST